MHISNKSSLDDIAFPAMTVRELLIKTFNDDWNTRRLVMSSSAEGDVLNVYLTFHDMTVDMAVAKIVLDELSAAERARD